MYETLFEQIFQEATALEVYNQTFASKLPADIFLQLIKMDPTSTIVETEPDVGKILSASKKGAYSDWIIRQFSKTAPTAQARFLSEDAEKIKKSLETYKALTQNKEGVAKLSKACSDAGLDIQNVKDLNQFKTLQMLFSATASFANKDTAELSTKEENMINVIYNDDTWQVVSPLTHAAARKYGTGTEWCTATSNPSWFENYTKDGPLFIIRAKKLSPPDCKWQYHKQSGQFMNFADNALSVRSWLLKYLAADKERVNAMAIALSKASKSSAWDPTRFEKEIQKDIAIVKKAVEDAGDIDEAVIGKAPVIIYACRKNNTDLLDILLNQYHADPGTYDMQGNSAMSHAVAANNVDAVKMLLAAGDPALLLSQRSGSSGSTPLHLACGSGNPVMLRAMLEKLPENLRIPYLTLRDFSRRTPIIYTVDMADSNADQTVLLEVIKLIVEIFEGGIKSLSESVLAKIFEDEGSIPAEPQKQILNLRDLGGDTVLSLSILKGFGLITKYLREHGATLEAVKPQAIIDSWNKRYSWFCRALLKSPQEDVLNILLQNVKKLKYSEKLVTEFFDAAESLSGEVDEDHDGRFIAKKWVEPLKAIVRKTYPVIKALNPVDEDDDENFQESIDKLVEDAVQYNSLDLLKFLHEELGAAIAKTSYRSRGVDLRILRRFLSYLQSPDDELKAMLDYLLAKLPPNSLLKVAKESEGIFEIVSGPVSGVEGTGGCSEEFLEYLASKVPEANLKTFFGKDINLKGAINRAHLELYGSEDSSDAFPQRKPSAGEVTARVEKLKHFLDFLIGIYPKSLDASRWGYADDDSPFLYCFVLEPPMMDIAVYLTQKGFKPNPRTLVYYAIINNQLIRADEEDFAITIPLVRELLKFVRATFPNININKPNEESWWGDETALDALLNCSDRDARNNEAYAALIDEFRAMGALMYKELATAQNGVSTKPLVYFNARSAFPNPPPRPVVARKPKTDATGTPVTRRPGQGRARVPIEDTPAPARRRRPARGEYIPPLDPDEVEDEDEDEDE